MLPKHIQDRIDKAPAMFHRNLEPTMLEVDADSLIYKVAATTRNLETAKRRFVSKALELHFLADAAFSTLHLTPKHCKKANRFSIKAAKPYQDNRSKSKGKPELVEPLRYVVGRQQLDLPEEFGIVFNDVLEADDSVRIACHSNPKAIFYSEDKDLDCITNRKLNQHSLLVDPVVVGVGWLNLVPLSRSKKVVGRGAVFFWAQMLMGDTADNIKGILEVNGKNCGAVSTFELLRPYLAQSMYNHQIVYSAITTEEEIARFVLGLYKEIDQNPWSEGWLLWLYRSEKYTFYVHLLRLGLLGDDELGVWLKAKLKEDWFDKE